MFRPRDFYFRLDLRSLGLFRLCLGVLLIRDGLARWPDLELFYTSFGLMGAPEALKAGNANPSFWLSHAGFSLPIIQLLFLLGFVGYLGLFLGLATKVFHLLSFLFFTFVIAHHSVWSYGGERVLVALLFWSLFLPLGARFSLDAVRGRSAAAGTGQLSPPSVAALAIVSHLALVYLVTAIAKGMERPWQDGTALAGALCQVFCGDPAGGSLAKVTPPFILKGVTWGTLGLEFAAPLLMFFPFFQPLLRRIALIGFGSLHLAILFFFAVGDFSLIMLSWWVLCLRPEEWQLFSRWYRRVAVLTAWPWVSAVGRRLSGMTANWRARRPSSSLPPADELPLRGNRRLSGPMVANMLVGLIFLAVCLDAYNSVSKAHPVQCKTARAVVRPLGLWQSWYMYRAPIPHYWWVMVGKTESGTLLDPLTGAPPSWERPVALPRRYGCQYQTFMLVISRKHLAPFRRAYAEYLIRKNHRDAPPGHRLAELHWYAVRLVDSPPMAPTTIRIPLLHLRAGPSPHLLSTRY